MKTIILFVLMCGASFSAYGQGIGVINAASQHGIIAPGSLAEIQGESFTEESTYAEFPGDLSTELDGVSVSIGGVLCRLWYVTPQHIQAIVPDFPIRTSYHFGWKQVEVKCKDGRLLHGWTVVLPVAPGIVFQKGMPQGLWNVPGEQKVGVIAADEPIPAGATVGLTGTGFKFARNVTVFLMTDTEWFAVPGKVGPFAISQESWLQTVYFDLPPQIVGRVSVIIAADSVNWTQEFQLTTQQP
jgi:uncharacterized protein (TIGR03437 family)